jgi:hypothetical protein
MNYVCYQDDGMKYGCYQKETSLVRIVNEPSQCTASEVVIQWNEFGATDAIGPAALQGTTRQKPIESKVATFPATQPD